MCLFTNCAIMACTSKRRVPREDTEEFEKIIKLVKVLQRQEHSRYSNRDGKIDLSKLQDEILATVKLLQKNLRTYVMQFHHDLPSEVDVPEKWEVTVEENRKLTEEVDRLKQRLSKMHEIKVQLDSDIEIAEDNFQEMKLRVEKLRENELHQKEQISRLHKEVEEGNSKIYKLTDENKCLIEDKSSLEEKNSFAKEEIENLKKKLEDEQKETESKLKDIQRLEENIQNVKIVTSKLNTKLNLSEADRFRLEGEFVKCKRKVEDLQVELEQRSKQIIEMEKECEKSVQKDKQENRETARNGYTVEHEKEEVSDKRTALNKEQQNIIKHECEEMIKHDDGGVRVVDNKENENGEEEENVAVTEEDDDDDGESNG